MPPERPVLRILRTGGQTQDFVLPGAGQGRAQWLGLVPGDARELRLAAGPGLVLEGVGLRSHADVLLECLARRPWRCVSALYERARGDGRRYRDILRGACAVTPLTRYPEWAAARAGGGATLHATMPVTVLVPVRAGRTGGLADTMASLVGQTHRDWQALVAWEGGVPAEAVSLDARVSHATWDPDHSLTDLLSGADAVCLLEPGDALAGDALALLATAAADADLVYADEIGADGTPRLKPDWSPDFAMAQGYQGRPQLLTRSLLSRLPKRPAGAIADFSLALALAAASACERPRHVPRVLARTVAAEPDAQTRIAALGAHLAAVGSPAKAVLRGGVADLLWPLPQPAPLVSIVIPSRDRLDLIAPVCRGVLHETAYPAIELVIVDNGSTDPGVLAHYEDLRADPRVKIVSYPEAFNFSAMVNAGVAAGTGAVVVLLNNDVAVLEPGWLEAMVRQACRPEVGAVGAKLLYGNGTLQHAGVVVGLGGRAGHILRRRPGDTPGHLGQLRVAHEVSAVTAACLAVTRAKYDAVGGFDAQAFPIDFNDVDFCLRLGAAGFKTVWTPAATLAHLESVSRGPSVGAARARFEAEAERFSARWRDAIRHDPFYHPALSLTTFGEDLE
ncbi:glycosyltransferase family 2 protein [Methylobacterium trifolii]|nr:glycosyltransferase [Methylobacterium trifolii]